jgi:hypothetical protein
MKRLLIGLLAIALQALAHAGDINLGTPLVSGIVSKLVNRQKTGQAELSSLQLQGLADWLASHRSGWQGMTTDATSEPAELEINLRHFDGTISSIAVIAQSNGGRYLRITGPGKWAYESFHGTWRSWAATRTISDQELAALERLASTT